MAKSKSKSKARTNGKPSVELLDKAACPLCKGTGSIRKVNPLKLRKRREARGLSMRQMAKKIGISRPFVSDVESGKRPCPAHMLKHYQKL